MMSVSRSWKVPCTLLSISVAAMLATMADAADCWRYVSFDGTTTSIDVSCAEQLGITPIFVRDTPQGYDIVVAVTRFGGQFDYAA